jgi:hypothetical protein
VADMTKGPRKRESPSFALAYFLIVSTSEVQAVEVNTWAEPDGTLESRTPV